jgi:hypothetical protein
VALSLIVRLSKPESADFASSSTSPGQSPVTPARSQDPWAGVDVSKASPGRDSVLVLTENEAAPKRFFIGFASILRGRTAKSKRGQLAEARNSTFRRSNIL